MSCAKKRVDLSYRSARRMTCFLRKELPFVRCSDCSCDNILVALFFNKSSALAEMGDRLATIDMGRKLGAVPLFGERELGPHLLQCRLSRDLPPYQVAS